MELDPSNPPPDPYVALGVPTSATPQEIKTAYRALARTTHPDKAPKPELKEEYTERFQNVQQAYELLADGERKREYDDLQRLKSLREKLRERHNTSAGIRTTSGTFVHRGPPMRTQTFYADNAATGAGARFEERKPRSYFDDDDVPRGTTRKGGDDYDGPRRSSASGKKNGPDRVRAERMDKEAEDRRRKEKLNDQDINRSRNSKYEYEDRYPSSPRDRERERDRDRDYDDADRVRRRADTTSDKYDEWTKHAQMHQSFYDDTPSRPTVRREGSSFAYVRRSQAPPRDRSERDNDRIKLEELKKEKERLQKKQAERERRRPSESPIPEDYKLPRRETEPMVEKAREPPSPGPTHPTFQRSESTPILGGGASPPNMSARRKTTGLSKDSTSPPKSSRLRETVYADDSGYSSSSSVEPVKPKFKAAKPVRTTSYKYAVPSRDRSRSREREAPPRDRRRGSDDSRMPKSSPNPVRLTRSPERLSDRERSDRSDRERDRDRDRDRQRDREEMARREARMRERARDRDREQRDRDRGRRSDEYFPFPHVSVERERERDRDRERPAAYSPSYSRKQSYSRDDVSYSPNITKDDVRYGQLPRMSHRRNASGGGPPGLGRSSTMPVFG